MFYGKLKYTLEFILHLKYFFLFKNTEFFRGGKWYTAKSRKLYGGKKNKKAPFDRRATPPKNKQAHEEDATHTQNKKVLFQNAALRQTKRTTVSRSKSALGFTQTKN